ncbi:RNA-binding protein RBP-3 [Trypanosoma grayi]|uniref:RNA-binding protein RBP-3 n=1 Tax=Trypanosoma grayi TaxID=71804 RepID=UPI0004F437D0|nr:RNA-binding protein RBP-3 [Trypanosoma grayi]KEG09242.1 RNA-binding protein RBP-3 [Trypanosoma grayi]
MEMTAENVPAEESASPAQPQQQQQDQEQEPQKQHDQEQEPQKWREKAKEQEQNSPQHVSAYNTPEHAPCGSSEDFPNNGSSPFMSRPCCATDPEPLRNLIVNYLPPMMDEVQLCHLFGQFGPIESVKIIFDKETRESRGYGFVKYVHFFSATYAVNSLNGYHIGGKRLKVAYANVEAAMENYRALRMSAMMFSMQQQMALQSVFCQQMLLARQQGDGPQ